MAATSKGKLLSAEAKLPREVRRLVRLVVCSAAPPLTKKPLEELPADKIAEVIRILADVNASRSKRGQETLTDLKQPFVRRWLRS